MRSVNRIIVITLLLTDIGLVTWSVMVTSWYFFGDWRQLESLIYSINMTWLATSLIHFRPNPFDLQKFPARLRQVLRRWFTCMAVLAIWNQLFPVYPSVGIILLAPGIIFLLLQIPAVYLTGRLMNPDSGNPQAKKILIAGTGRSAKAIREYYRKNPSEGEIIGCLHDGERKTGNSEILGSYADLPDVLKKSSVNELIIALGMREEETIKKLICQSEKYGIRPVVAADYQGTFRRSVDVQKLGDIPVVRIREVPLDDHALRLWKRLFDLIFSLTVLILLSPLMLTIAIAIKMESRGPVFYRPVRIGRLGQTIRIFKFRSMKHQTGPPSDISTRLNDDRITRVGRFIRRYSLDELPQFFNVLSGEMSVVGPRPHRPDLENRFRQAIYTYPVRQYIKPGITGWAQVNGWRGPTETRHQFIARTLHDLWYMEHWTLLLDAAIVLLTVFGKKTRLNAF